MVKIDSRQVTITYLSPEIEIKKLDAFLLQGAIIRAYFSRQPRTIFVPAGVSSWQFQDCGLWDKLSKIEIKMATRFISILEEVVHIAYCLRQIQNPNGQQ
jgi:hypothetical protein